MIFYISTISGFCFEVVSYEWARDFDKLNSGNGFLDLVYVGF